MNSLKSLFKPFQTVLGVLAVCVGLSLAALPSAEAALTVTDMVPSSVTSTSAVMITTLVSTNASLPATVYQVWGSVDGGTVAPYNWRYAVVYPATNTPPVVFTNTAYGLRPGSVVLTRTFAVDSSQTVVSPLQTFSVYPVRGTNVARFVLNTDSAGVLQDQGTNLFAKNVGILNAAIDGPTNNGTTVVSNEVILGTSSNGTIVANIGIISNMALTVASTTNAITGPTNTTVIFFPGLLAGTFSNEIRIVTNNLQLIMMTNGVSGITNHSYFGTGAN